MKEKLDDILPDVTRQVVHIQYYNNLWIEADEDGKADLEFILVQLLAIGKHMDFAEEIGRRQMLTLMRMYFSMAIHIYCCE